MQIYNNLCYATSS